MDPYFEIYIPRLTRTLKESQLRARRKLHRGKDAAAFWKDEDEKIADRLSNGAKEFFEYIGEKIVYREDKSKVSDAMWTIIGVLEGHNACNRTHCQYNNSRRPYSCGAGKRTHTCKEYDKYMRKKSFGAEVCKECRHAKQTKKWGAVCWMRQYDQQAPEGCPRKEEPCPKN